MGFLCKSALPPHLDDPSEWEGTDDSVWYMRWRMHVKHWFAFANRCPQGLDLMLFPPFICFRKWRLKPFTIFAVRGNGYWRLEKPGKEMIDQRKVVFMEDYDNGYYLSRVQYWTRWHFHIQWPFSISLHIYYKSADVIPAMARGETDGKLFNFYLGSHYDADQIHWFPSGFLGGNWK